MVEVTVEWLIDNSVQIIAFGGQITERNLKQHVDGKVQTSLTHAGVKAVENERYEGKFTAVLPGIGIAECFV